MKVLHAPRFREGREFLYCSMPGCDGFAKNARLFVLHMKRKHGVTVSRTAVAARQMVSFIVGVDAANSLGATRDAPSR